MTAGGSDPALRRFERDAVGACLVMVVAAFAVVAPWRGTGPALRASLGVLGGGLLVAVSYRAIKGAAGVVMRTAEAMRQPETQGSTAGDQPSEQGFSPACPPVLSPGRRAFLAVKFFTRYALLAVAAYVMLTCFRLHPVGVLAGVTSPFLAALLQVVRMSRARRPHP